VPPQDRQEGGAMEFAHNAAVRPPIGTTLAAIGFDVSSSAARVIASV
jgi:hypothetical protein